MRFSLFLSASVVVFFFCAGRTRAQNDSASAVETKFATCIVPCTDAVEAQLPQVSNCAHGDKYVPARAVRPSIHSASLQHLGVHMHVERAQRYHQYMRAPDVPGRRAGHFEHSRQRMRCVPSLLRVAH